MNEPELPEGWPDAFDEDARDYLYEAAVARLQEITDFGSRQQDKALALLRLSFVLIAVGGIFGDLHLGLNTLGIPREWATGTDVDWLARWEGASRRGMKDAVLEYAVSGFQRNRALTATRGKLLTALVVALALQTVFVVLVQIVSALD